MFDTLKRLYLAGKLNEAGLTTAVTKGWITEAQKTEIISSTVQ